ncbi:DNA phosphorothioation-associated putative methyltransferase [Piscinibacter gummiphilus]|uniref:DNA phosphorothioation-associated putative methyltransferase n=1 Tax=Piscinibacter gummiphilus TaxID=946333 RepID=A0ABZ0D8J5_9BURK|nr:DNA phosphorothioation-associated putative methyltransferase [Piscinibacter gummiphilus]WOB11323.1 DNA phosphorothioation-associated putative methyltransferase [Piscinibacter gummiphilus]
MGVGKRVGDEIYVHRSSVRDLADASLHPAIEQALERLDERAREAVNVVKINTRSQRVGLLSYPDFEEDPFPALAFSWSPPKNGSGELVMRSYIDSLNPPILHRKELLVSEHPDRDSWGALTAQAEALGLFDDPLSIGFRMNWLRLIAAKGFQLVGGRFAPLGNADGEIEGEQQLAGRSVRRHLTALGRSVLSAPVQMLLRLGVLNRETSFFDYGCGRGDDLATLSADGFSANGWDPHYAPERPLSAADVVNVGFVINVIEDPAERVDVLHRAFSLAQRVMSVAVMLYGPGNAGKPFGDGFMTSRGTFQKYFQQAELKDYLEQALHQEAILVGPGMALVFKDKDWEQRYLAGRYRRRDVTERMLAVRPRLPKPASEKPVREIASPRAPEPPHPLLAQLWHVTLDLGRYPEEAEVDRLAEVIDVFGSLGRAIRKMVRSFDAAVLDKAQTARADDLRLYFAIQQFSKRPRYRQLEVRLQRDVKAFFGDYSSAQAAGMELLTRAADGDALLAACREAVTSGLGWLEGDHLQLHVSLVERLPIVLRAFVSCGLLVYGDLSDVDLVKVHCGSGKLTLMQFENFDEEPLPLMTKRIKVNVRRADYDLFEYGTEYPKPPLYLKSRYMHEEMAHYQEQEAFDRALEETGVLGSSEHGPSYEQLETGLARRRLEVSGFTLRRSTNIPALDEPCGATFTYRSFIECGETQARLRLPNTPLNPESYNAMYDLAVKLLDPIVEYFGAIRLTYGFCSPKLGAQIKGRVAPELDQHAAHELNRRGQPICARGGAACDFVVDDEDMEEVAEWIITNLPFDRLYFYGKDKPIHLSYSPSELREATEMRAGPSGRLVPRRYKPRGSAA